MTATYLRDQGHHVYTAGDGMEALAILKRRRTEIDVAVVDFAMPDMNGLQVARLARETCPGLPIVMLTGYFDVSLEEEGVSVVQKPFSDAALSQAIAAAAPECVHGEV